jgi:hypothetical protein
MNNEEPRLIVTDLQADRTDQLCPGERVTVVATTSPPDAVVAWTIAIDGGAPRPAQGVGNTFRTQIGRKGTIVITATLTNSLSVTTTWREADVRIELEPDTAGAVAGLVGIECGVVSGVINLESSGVEASDWRPRHDEHYHEA